MILANSMKIISLNKNMLFSVTHCVYCERFVAIERANFIHLLLLNSQKTLKSFHGNENKNKFSVFMLETQKQKKKSIQLSKQSKSTFNPFSRR